jgi:hypothetical protein
MIERIKDHNDLNGVRFATIEFSIIAAVGVVLTLIVFVLGRWVVGLAFLGITGNALVIVAVGARSMQSGKRSSVWKALRGDTRRSQVAIVRPHMMLDTVILVVALLIPYIVIFLAAVESFATRPRARK